MEIVISILYWGLRSIDTSLVVPPDLPLPPLLFDLTFHFFPALVLTIDAVLLSPPWPSQPVNQRASGVMLGVSTAVAFSYWWWIELCFKHNGFYPYPIFEMLSTGQRVGLFATSGAIMWGVGGALRVVYAWVNGLESVEELEMVKKATRGGKWE
jgi:hypothetical protein